MVGKRVTNCPCCSRGCCGGRGLPNEWHFTLSSLNYDASINPPQNGGTCHCCYDSSPSLFDDDVEAVCDSLQGTFVLTNKTEHTFYDAVKYVPNIYPVCDECNWVDNRCEGFPLQEIDMSVNMQNYTTICESITWESEPFDIEGTSSNSVSVTAPGSAFAPAFCTKADCGGYELYTVIPTSRYRWLLEYVSICNSPSDPFFGSKTVEPDQCYFALHLISAAEVPVNLCGVDFYNYLFDLEGFGHEYRRHTDGIYFGFNVASTHTPISRSLVELTCLSSTWYSRFATEASTIPCAPLRVRTTSTERFRTQRVRCSNMTSIDIYRD